MEEEHHSENSAKEVTKEESENSKEDSEKSGKEKESKEEEEKTENDDAEESEGSKENEEEKSEGNSKEKENESEKEEKSDSEKDSEKDSDNDYEEDYEEDEEEEEEKSDKEEVKEEIKEKEVNEEPTASTEDVDCNDKPEEENKEKTEENKDKEEVKEETKTEEVSVKNEEQTIHETVEEKVQEPANEEPSPKVEEKTEGEVTYRELEIQHINNQQNTEKINIGLAIHEPNSNSASRTMSPRSPRIRQYPMEQRRTTDLRYSLPEFRAPEVTAEALNIKQKALKLEPIPRVDDDIFTQAIYSLSEDRRAKIQEHKFIEGSKINRAIEHLKEFQLKYQKKFVNDHAQSEFKNLEMNLMKEIQDFDKETKRLTNELEANLGKQRKEMVERHERELDDHEALWNSDQMMKMFNHASTKLTTLRSQMTSLLLQCRFEEAGMLEQEANQQKVYEEAKNYEVMQTRFNESQKLLLEKQKQELSQFDIDCKVKVKQFINDRSIARRPLEHKEKRVEFIKESLNDKEKLWNKERLRTANKGIRGDARSITLIPSNRVTKSDIEKSDYTLLSLPPLKSTRKKTKKRN